MPVVLAGGIDRGGVIAQTVESQAVPDPDDATLVAGFLVNTFRGNLRLFDEGYRLIEARTGRHGFGVLPWFPGAGQLPAEDALDIARGGCQMLRRAIRDPDGIEGPAGGDAGQGLLDVVNEMTPQKRLTRVEARHAASGKPISGCEIHIDHGEGPDRARPFAMVEGRGHWLRFGMACVFTHSGWHPWRRVPQRASSAAARRRHSASDPGRPRRSQRSE